MVNNCDHQPKEGMPAKGSGCWFLKELFLSEKIGVYIVIPKSQGSLLFEA